MDKLSIKLEIFEGPLDLLLHLIQKNKVNIYDIPISMISEQYIGYLHTMKELDLEVASEFIVLASQLLYIKSKMLLPKSIMEGEADPRLELVEKLLEYKLYKEITSYFAEREKIGGSIFVKEGEHIDSDRYKNVKLNATIDELKEAIFDILKKIQRQKPPPKANFNGIVERKMYSISEMKLKIIDILNKDGKTGFLTLFHPDMPKSEIVAVFLAVLDMLRQNIIQAIKQGKKGTIYIIPETHAVFGLKHGDKVWS